MNKNLIVLLVALALCVSALFVFKGAKASTPPTVLLDFYSQACSAEWKNLIGTVPHVCDGINDSNGSIQTPLAAILEDHRFTMTPIFITLPKVVDVAHSSMYGKFNAITIQAGDYLEYQTSCQYSIPCNMIFYVEYDNPDFGFMSAVTANGQQLDGTSSEMKFDLSFLLINPDGTISPNKTLTFYLVVQANEDVKLFPNTGIFAKVRIMRP